MSATESHAYDGEPEDEATVDIERMPDIGGWELYKAIDAEESRERWTLAFRRESEGASKSEEPGRGPVRVEYALWLDPAGDPEKTGIVDCARHLREPWLRGEDLGDEGREAIVLALAKEGDRSFGDYAHRVLVDFPGLGEDGEDDGDFDDDGDDDSDSDGDRGGR